MALKETPTAVRVIDTVLGRTKNGPGSFYRCPQGHGVNHSQAPRAEMSVLGNSPNPEMFPLFPDRIPQLVSRGLACVHAAMPSRCHRHSDTKRTQARHRDRTRRASSSSISVEEMVNAGNVFSRGAMSRRNISAWRSAISPATASAVCKDLGRPSRPSSRRQPRPLDSLIEWRPLVREK
jgi:hypothetical protein